MKLLLTTSLLWVAVPAMSACRVTDFTIKPLSSLNEVEKLSLTAQMTRIEFDRLHALPANDTNYYAVIADATSVVAARKAALEKLYGLNIENIDGYREIWATDFLTDEQLQKYTYRLSTRAPGLTSAGRFEAPGDFHLTIVHLTPIGVEKITTKVVATHNIANVKEFESYLAELGPQDNYGPRTFSLKLVDPSKAAVVVMRAGWETTKFTYIPVFPTPNYFK